MSTILHWFTAGGPFVAPVVLVGVIGLAYVAERIWYISARSRVHARPFADEVVSLTRAGNVEEALRLCADHQAALADLGLVVLRNDAADARTLRETSEAAALSILPPHRRSAGPLTALTLILLLLGAVGALANLHAVLTATDPTGDVWRDAAVYALRPVGVALLLALPLVAGGAFVAAASERLAEQLHDFSTRLVSAMTDAPDVRLGHRA